MDDTAKNYIISENKDFALVNKPVGMDSEHAMGDGFFPIHRLDKVASGLLLYAKNPISAKSFPKHFKRARLKRNIILLSKALAIPPKKRMKLCPSEQTTQWIEDLPKLSGSRKEAVSPIIFIKIQKSRRCFLSKNSAGG